MVYTLQHKMGAMQIEKKNSNNKLNLLVFYDVKLVSSHKAVVEDNSKYWSCLFLTFLSILGNSGDVAAKLEVSVEMVVAPYRHR